MPISDELHVAYSKAIIDLEICQVRVNMIKKQLVEAMQQQPMPTTNMPVKEVKKEDKK